MFVLSLDPGSRNFAYCVTSIDENKFRFLEIGQISNTIVNLTALTRKSKKIVDESVDVMTPKYIKSMSGLLTEYAIQEIVIERFQARGLKGSTIEAVSIMVGILMCIAHNRGLKIRLITAAQWKNQVNRIVTLNNSYGESHKLGFTPHETDASYMGIYHYHAQHGGDLEWVNRVIQEMERYAAL